MYRNISACKQMLKLQPGHSCKTACLRKRQFFLLKKQGELPQKKWLLLEKQLNTSRVKKENCVAALQNLLSKNTKPFRLGFTPGLLSGQKERPKKKGLAIKLLLARFCLKKWLLSNQIPFCFY